MIKPKIYKERERDYIIKKKYTDERDCWEEKRGDSAIKWG